MSSKKTLNAKNLASLGAQRLSELLIEISTGNITAKHRLRLELAGRRAPPRLREKSANGWRRSLAPAGSSTGRTGEPWSMICKSNAAPSSTQWLNVIRSRDWT